MTSLLENNKAAEFICIYILGENLSNESVSKLKELVESYNRKVVFVDTAPLVAKMRELNMPTYRGSYAANMRLFVSEIVGNDGGAYSNCKEDDDVYTNDGCKIPVDDTDESACRRMLYLDADTIVTGDLTNMYNQPIKTVGMVYDTLASYHKYDIGLDETDGYYNSGVILYDLDKWKENHFTEKIIDHVKNVRAQYPSPDQDLINVVVRKEIMPIGCECNLQPHLKDYPYDLFMKVFKPEPYYSKEQVGEAIANPVILHTFRYVGEFPWHKDNVHPFNDEFDKYLKISPWNDYVKENADGGIVIKCEKLMIKCLPKGIFLRIFKVMHERFYRKADAMSKKNVVSKSM